MPIRNLSAIDAWAERESPPPQVERMVRRWIRRLDHKPWDEPSIPLPDLSFQPDFEVRVALLGDTGGVRVYYRHEYAPEAVELIWVGRGIPF